MTRHPQPTLKDIAFAIRGSVLPKIVGRLALIAFVSVIAIRAADAHPGVFSRISAVPFTLIGIALSVFMSFRNSACYDRWWEARKLWGDLTIACRSFARQTSTLSEADRRRLLHGLCGFAAGLTARLRNTSESEAITRWVYVKPGSHGPNPTNAVLDELGKYCLTLMQGEKIKPIHYAVIERELTALSAAQGGCERIISTPVPFSYSLLLQRTALIFCLTLPFSVARSLGWWTLLPVLLVAYTFFGLDALGHQLENPFGLEPNALPLHTLRSTVEQEMLALLGESEIPPAQVSDR